MFLMNQRVRVKADATPDWTKPHAVAARGCEGRVICFIEGWVGVQVDGVEPWLAIRPFALEPILDPRAAQFIAEMNKYGPILMDGLVRRLA